jgi:hypothetical protein
MNTLNPSIRRADQGARFVRASVYRGFDAAGRLQGAGGRDGRVVKVHNASAGHDASANSLFAAL